MTPITPKTVLDGGRYFEGPRWHSGRLWFVDCMNRTLLSLGSSGECEQHAKIEDDTPCGLGILPDGRRTLFCLSAATSHEELRQRKSSARIDVVDVEIPGAGYP